MTVFELTHTQKRKLDGPVWLMQPVPYFGESLSTD